MRQDGLNRVGLSRVVTGVGEGGLGPGKDRFGGSGACPVFTPFPHLICFLGSVRICASN